MKRIITISAVAAMLASTAAAGGSADGLKIKCGGGSISFDGNLEITGDNGERVAIDGNRVSVKDSSGEELLVDIDRFDFDGGACRYSATVTDKDGKVIKTVTEDGEYSAPADQSSKNGKIVMKAVKSSMDFEKIEVSRCVKLIVEDRTDGNIIVRANENIMPYVELTVAKGALKAKISDKCTIRHRLGDEAVTEVYIPNNGRIRSLDASGASSIVVRPLLDVRELDVDASGASKIELKANAGETDIECSGASKVVAEITGAKCDIDISGASKLILSGSVGSGAIDVAGAAKCKASDMKFDALSIDVCGASSAEVNAVKCIVDASGASSAYVYCDGVLSAEATAASSIRYSGDCKISHISSSGASSIKRK